MKGCHAPLDLLGHHRASSPRSTLVKRRATPTERMTARVFREAGACVRQNVFLRDMNVNVPAQDSRQIEVLAQGLPCHGGIQLAVDTTLRSAVSCAGEAHPHAADLDGAVLLQARQDTEATYPELASSARCKLVVLAMETGGRWSEQAVQTLQMLHTPKRETHLRTCSSLWPSCGNGDGRECWPSRALSLSRLPWWGLRERFLVSHG